MPTVTDANLLLGRLLPDKFLDGKMELRADLAEAAIKPLADKIDKSPRETALGILRLAESSMTAAIRHVTARRGHDPRSFTLVSFGGAGGLHAAALAESLEISRVLIPPYAGLLSALGMLIAPASASVSQTVVHLAKQLDDSRLHAEFSGLSARSAKTLSINETTKIETFADCRFEGQSYEVMVPVAQPSREKIEATFREAYVAMYGRCPEGRAMEIVTLRLRRIGVSHDVAFSPLQASSKSNAQTRIVVPDGNEAEVPVIDRAFIKQSESLAGPALLIDPDSTIFIPNNWIARASEIGSIILESSK